MSTHQTHPVSDFWKDFWHRILTILIGENGVIELKDEDTAKKMISEMISCALWSKGDYIEFEEILAAINSSLDKLLDAGASSVSVIQGVSLADYLDENKEIISIPEIDLNYIRSGVILVATNDEGDIIDNVLIRSHNGLSQQAMVWFEGKTLLKVKLS